MSYEIIRWLKDGSRLILVPSCKRILYKHKTIHTKGHTRNGLLDVIQVRGTINPLQDLQNINGCV